MHFGQTLRVMRNMAGLSLRELAKRLSVSPAYVSQIERGKLPPPTDERIHDIEKILGLSSGYLLSTTGRVEGEVDEFLAKIPEACDFIRQAEKDDLLASDFGRLTTVLRRGGRCALRSLLREDVPEKILTEGRTSRYCLSRFLQKAGIFTFLQCRNKNQLFSKFASKVAPFVPEMTSKSLLELLWAREEVATTGIGAGIAIPHAIIPAMKETKLFLARLKQGVEYGAIDGEPVYLCFLILRGEEQQTEHLKLLGRIARVCSHPEFCIGVRRASSAASVLRFIQMQVSSIP